MGYDAEKGFTSSGVDPSWTAFLGDPQRYGIDQGVINENMDFIKSFVRDAQKSEAASNGGSKRKKPPPPAPQRAAHAQQDSSSSIATPPSLAPPPSPPSRDTPPRASPSALPTNISDQNVTHPVRSRFRITWKATLEVSY